MLHDHLLMASLSVEGVGGHYVVEDSFDSDAGLAESIRLAEGSFAKEEHAADIRHGKAIVVATSCGLVICILLDIDDRKIFPNERTHDSFHEAMALRIHRDAVDTLVVLKKRSGCQLAAACLAADSRGSLDCTYLDLSSPAGVSAFESATGKASESVRDEESGRAQAFRCACLWNLLL